MSSSYSHHRRKIHQKVVIRMVRWISTLTAFAIIFSSLFLISNWSAYSKILQDVIDPQAALETPEMRTPESAKKPLSFDSAFLESEKKSNHPFRLHDLGLLAPPDLRLEIPKVFSGSIPVKEIIEPDFTFKNYYESENKIQKALRDGVVLYPFSAYPGQFGNVFITGHSSYLPWDTGRYKDIFALLHKLQPGDEYVLSYQGKSFTYRVKTSFEISPDDVSVLSQPTDRKMSTLMTCTPVGTVLRRLVVQAELASDI